VRLTDLPPEIRAIGAVKGRLAPPAARGSGALEIPLDQPLDDIITEVIRSMVDREGGNRTRAAERLGIGLRTVQRRLRDVTQPT
jgi:DNA-binding NtrC family response regulator